MPTGGRVSDDTDIRIAVSDRALLRVRDARNLRFEGSAFAYSYGDIARVEGCEGVEFIDCRFVNTASCGIARATILSDHQSP